MSKIFRKYLDDNTPDGKRTVTNREFDQIISKSISKKIRKREFLLLEGTICQFSAFVCKGCLRVYRQDSDGTKHFMMFSIENWWAGDRESYTLNTPSKCNIDALEDTEILFWSKEDLEDLLKTIPAFKAIAENIHSRSFFASQNRIHAAISYTAEERIENFIKTYPKIYSRVPLHMIASYLGITRETLSRIRKQRLKK